MVYFLNVFVGNNVKLEWLFIFIFSVTVHSSLDDYLAHWFGLNQSKYQWALDDYYENESMVRTCFLSDTTFIDKSYDFMML